MSLYRHGSCNQQHNANAATQYQWCFMLLGSLTASCYLYSIIHRELLHRTGRAPLLHSAPVPAAAAHDAARARPFAQKVMMPKPAPIMTRQAVHSAASTARTSQGFSYTEKAP